jgi:hypothetical protein
VRQAKLLDGIQWDFYAITLGRPLRANTVSTKSAPT